MIFFFFEEILKTFNFQFQDLKMYEALDRVLLFMSYLKITWLLLLNVHMNLRQNVQIIMVIFYNILHFFFFNFSTFKFLLPHRFFVHFSHHNHIYYAFVKNKYNNNSPLIKTIVHFFYEHLKIVLNLPINIEG